MSDSSKHVIAVTVRPHLHAAVKAVADHEMCSVSDLVRRALAAKVREHGIDPLSRSTAGAAPALAAERQLGV